MKNGNDNALAKKFVVSEQLKNYALFLLQGSLENIIKESLISAQKLALPFLSIFNSFTEQKLFNYLNNKLLYFLKSIVDENALEKIQALTEESNSIDFPVELEDRLNTHHANIFGFQKFVLINFIDTYTNDLATYKSIVLEVEVFFTMLYDFVLANFLASQNESLQKEKDFNESLINFSHEGIVAFDQHLKYTAWNPQIERITGLKKIDVLGKHIFEVFPEFKNSKEGEVFLKVLSGETIHLHLGEYKNKSGYFESYVTPLLNEKKQITGGLSIIHDITERKKAEKKLKETRYFLNHVVNASPDLIYVLDLMSGKMIYSNRFLTDVLGYSTGDIFEEGFDLFRKIIYSEDIKIMEDRIEKFKRAGDLDVIESEIRFLKKDKGLTWLNVKSKIFKRNKKGKPIQIMGICSDITNRKEAEEELNQSKKTLEKSEMQLLEAQEISNLGSFDWNLLDNTASSTPMLRNIFGYNQNDSISFDDFEKFVHPEDHEKVKEAMNSALFNGSMYSCEYRIYRKNDQSLRYVWAKGKIDFNEKGVPQKMIGTVWDITERKEVEEKLKQSEQNLRELNLRLEDKVLERTIQLAESAEMLKESEEQMRLITNAVPALISYVDKNQIFKFINESYATWFGSSVNAILGNTVRDLLGDDAFKKVEGHIYAALKKGQQVSYETEMPYQFGGSKFVQGKFIPDFDESGNVKGMVTLILDITERKKAEDTLKSAFKHASIGMTITDLGGKYLYINPAYRKIVGFEESELHKLSVVDIIHPDDRTEKEQMLHKMLSKEIPGFVIDKRLIRKDGSIIWVQNSVSLIKDSEGKPYNIISLTQDITREKEAQEQVRLSAVQLKQINQELSQKNEQLLKINNDLDNFVYTASHDLKAPVSNIEGLVNTLSDTISAGDIDSDDLHMLLNLVNDSIQRFKNTITDLTEITKIQKDLEKEICEINLCEIIEDVKFSINDQIKKSQAKIYIETDLCPIIRFSKKDLKSIIYNLLSNAIKYKAPDRIPEIILRTTIENEFIVFSVKDNGLGLSEQNKSKAFQMFKRFHDHVEGSGIGLYIVKRIVENNGGRVELESEVNIGTTFKLFFKA